MQLRNMSIPDLEMYLKKYQTEIKQLKAKLTEAEDNGSCVAQQLFTKRSGIQVGSTMRNIETNTSAVVTRLNSYPSGATYMMVRKVTKNGAYSMRETKIYLSQVEQWALTGFDPEAAKMAEVERQQRLGRA